jgi:hypothetical protein
MDKVMDKLCDAYIEEILATGIEQVAATEDGFPCGSIFRDGDTLYMRRIFSTSGRVFASKNPAQHEMFKALWFAELARHLKESPSHAVHVNGRQWRSLHSRMPRVPVPAHLFVSPTVCNLENGSHV